MPRSGERPSALTNLVLASVRSPAHPCSMIISTKPYTEPELAAILAIRAEEEDVAMAGE